MATTVEKSIQINADVDTVFNTITTEEFLKAKYEKLGARNFKLVEHSSDGGGARVKYEREAPAEAPAALKKFVGDWTGVKSDDTWTGSVGGERNCKMAMELEAPVKMSATTKLTPNGDSTTLAVSTSVSCGIPLVGKKLEAFAAQNVESEMQEDLDFTKQFVEKG